MKTQLIHRKTAKQEVLPSVPSICFLSQHKDKKERERQTETASYVIMSVTFLCVCVILLSMSVLVSTASVTRQWWDILTCNGLHEFSRNKIDVLANFLHPNQHRTFESKTWALVRKCSCVTANLLITSLHQQCTESV